ncbi:PREDICTED: uncharacterized protein LOC105119785, partial [Populus euphratica]|uniref:Uncharacterized protein LOC105119785 n=1 Tax=Populus euphratica TaxID=75702 RepID=A0AAJ6XES6_POPEU
MANKKKKTGSHKSQLKQQNSELLHDLTVLALAAPSLSRTVHATVHHNSNLNHSPPNASAPNRTCTDHHVISSPHGSEPQHHTDPSPSINHVLVDDWSDEEDLEDEEVDFDSSPEDYAGGSKFFTSPVVSVPPVHVASSPSAQPTAVGSPVVVQSVDVASPVSGQPDVVVKATCTTSVPTNSKSAPVDHVVSGNSNHSEPSSSSWRNLFVSNRDNTRCPKLLHYSALTDTRGCNLFDDDLDIKCDLWKRCLVGYIAGRSPGFKALQNLIVNTWQCEASITIHDSGWLIFTFDNDADKSHVLDGGPYLVYGRPLILKPMTEYFEFSSTEMHTVPVWVKFPNLPLKCWSLKCLSKIASVLGRPVQSDMFTASMARLSYARVLVEVNLLSDLPSSIEVTLPNGHILHQQVVYETLPRFCKHCRKLGHLTSTCTNIPPSNITTNPKTSVFVAPAPTGRNSVCNCLEPQQGPSVNDKPEVNLPNASIPHSTPIETELDTMRQDATSNPEGWEVVQRKKGRRKHSPSRVSLKSRQVDSHLSHKATHTVQEESQLHPSSPVIHTISTPPPEVDSGTTHGKSVVAISAPGQCTSCSIRMPISKRAQQLTNGVSGRALSKVSSMQQFRLKKWKVHSNAEVASSARIVVFWNPATVHVELLDVSAQGLHVLISSRVHQFSIYATFVYGFNTLLARRTLWSDLRNWNPNSPWIILGDFNSVLSQDDKHNGEAVSTYETADFRQCCSDLGLIDLNYSGCHYTWSNGKVWTKLDRALVNSLWSPAHASAHVHFDNPGAFSDHSPVTITLQSRSFIGKKSFKFFNMWTHHVSFSDLVAANWHHEFYGSPMFTFCKRLKALKGPLRELNRLHYSHISARVARAEAALDHHQTIFSNDRDNPQLLAEDKLLQQQFLHLKAAERQFFSQKLKFTFLKECDQGSSFFHALMSRKHWQNYIPAIHRSDGTITTSIDEVGTVFVDYFSHLLGTSKDTLPLDSSVIQHGPCLDANTHASLLAPFTDLDIKNVLFAIDDDKAPGPDGYSSCFFKKSWDVIGGDFCRAVRDFFESGAMLKQINHSIIALIPKSTNSSFASDFRPISCCNVIYKVIAKLLAVRLSHALSNIISPIQNAFLGGRLMADNIHLLQELLRDYERKRSSPRCLLKIDFRKAFDSVQWPFLRQLLLMLGFPNHFVHLIMQCVETASYSIAVNDDVILLSRGDRQSVSTLFSQLVSFGEVSGLEINANKSFIFFGGVTDSIKQLILQDTGFVEGSFPFRYLGVPLSPHRLLASQFSPLLNKIHSTIYGWLGKHLSYAGRVELLKSVLFGMVHFWLNIFPVPDTVIKQITSLCRNFLWTGNVSRSKSALVAWRTVCLPKVEGGLGLFDIKACNNSYLAKHIWNIHLKADSIWIQWVHHYYLHSHSIWNTAASPTSSPLWKSIIILRDNLVEMGGGQSNTVSLMAHWSTSTGPFTAHAYDFLRVRSSLVRWRNVVWESWSMPRYNFILWLAVLGRLRTRDRLHFLQTDSSCVFCQVEEESHSHLFFGCTWTSSLWLKIKNWLRISRTMSSLLSAIRGLSRIGNNAVRRMRRASLGILLVSLAGSGGFFNSASEVEVVAVSPGCLHVVLACWSIREPVPFLIIFASEPA